MLGWTAGGRKKENERIEALERAQERIESSIRLLKTEWIDTYERMNKVMGRLNARIRKAADEVPAEEHPAQEPTGPGPVGTHALLTAARARRGRP